MASTIGLSQGSIWKIKFYIRICFPPDDLFIHIDYEKDLVSIMKVLRSGPRDRVDQAYSGKILCQVDRTLWQPDPSNLPGIHKKNSNLHSTPMIQIVPELIPFLRPDNEPGCPFCWEILKFSGDKQTMVSVCRHKATLYKNQYLDNQGIFSVFFITIAKYRILFDFSRKITRVYLCNSFLGKSLLQLPVQTEWLGREETALRKIQMYLVLQ